MEITEGKIRKIADGWSCFSSLLDNSMMFEGYELQELLKATYEVLYKYKSEKLVPKEIFKMLFNMNELIGDIENADWLPICDYASVISTFTFTLMSGFLDDDYPCAYPVLNIKDYEEENHAFNLEKDDIGDMIELLRTQFDSYDINKFAEISKKKEIANKIKDTAKADDKDEK